MKGKKCAVAVIGNAGIDTTIYLHGREIDLSVESNFTENLDYVGQAGGFSARGYAQLGYHTSFIGYLGNDYSGRFIREEFEKDGIHCDGIFIDPEGTSRSVNIMSPDGHRRNFYDGKGHMHLSPNRILCEKILSEVAIAHFHLPNWARDLLPLAKKHGVKIASDLQDIMLADDEYRRDFVELSDVLFFSATNYQSPEGILRYYLDRYPDKIFIAGMGAQGCALGTRDGIRFFPPVALADPVIDTNGAGDGLAVGFLASYFLEGYTLEDALLRGLITARHTCSQRASTSSLITKEVLNRLFQAKHP